LHQWHWISSALCLLGMLAFAATGITLNHAGAIEAEPRVVSRNAELPAELLAQTAAAGIADGAKAPLPAGLRRWLAAQWAIHADGRDAEWSADEIYLSLPRPGGDAWLSIDRESGAVEYESTDRGWISYL